MVRMIALALLGILALVVMPVASMPAEDDGELVFKQNCQLCHTAERVQAKQLTRAEWQKIIDRMAGLGCPIRTSKKKQQVVLDYLVRTQGPVAGATVASVAPATPSTSAPAYTGPAARA
jgi:hypothetical protein